MATLDADALWQKMLVAVLQVAQEAGPALTGCLEDGLKDISELAKKFEELAAKEKLTQEQRDFFKRSIEIHAENAVDTCDYQMAALAKKAMDAALDVMWAALKAAAPL